MLILGQEWKVKIKMVTLHGEDAKRFIEQVENKATTPEQLAFLKECSQMLDEKTPLTTLYVMRDNKPMIAIDREDCFDKLSKCPIIVNMPTTEEEVDTLNAKIEWLKSDEGLDASNEYDTDKWLRHDGGW